MTSLHTIGLLVVAYALVAGALALLFIAFATACKYTVVAPLAGAPPRSSRRPRRSDALNLPAPPARRPTPGAAPARSRRPGRRRRVALAGLGLVIALIAAALHLAGCLPTAAVAVCTHPSPPTPPPLAAPIPSTPDAGPSH